MDEILIERWNSVVKPNDEVYHLGDLAWGGVSGVIRYVPRLNGKIILIEGNHDRINKDNIKLFKRVHPGYFNLKIDKRTWITLCHYSMRVWYNSHFNTWHLYGHSHGGLPPEGKSWDAGVDANNYTPISLEEVREIMKHRPDNFNLIKK